MATIEERAKMQARLLTCKKCTFCKHSAFIFDLSKSICVLEGDERCEKYYAAIQAYIFSATEQDRISPQEERERCILMAQKYACRNCLNEGICDGTRMCTIKENIRKAIEEGGV